MYLSPINRLRTVYRHRSLCNKFDSRNKRTVEEGVYHDAFGGRHYQALFSEYVHWGMSPSATSTSINLRTWLWA